MVPYENLNHPDFYKHLLDTIDEGLLVMDKDDRIFYVNAPMARIAGIPRERIIGLEVLRDFSEGTLREFRSYYLQARENLTTVSFDAIAVVTPAGRMTYQSGSCIPVMHEDHFDGMMCTIRDVTEQREGEEALRHSEEQYRTLIDNMQDAVFRADLEGNLIFTSPSAARILGCSSPEEMIGMKISDDFHYYPEEAEKQFEILQKDGILTQHEIILKRRDNGEPVFISANVQFARDKKGDIIGIEGVYNDITKRKQAEDALRKSEAKYRLLHQSMRDAFVGCELDGAIREFNDAYVQMIGYRPDEIYGLNYRDITPEKWHAFEDEIHKKQVFPRGYSDIYEKEYRRKDGTIFPVELRATLLRDDAGNPAGLWAIVRDISERKRVEQERETLISELQQALSEIKTLSGLLPICSSCKKIRDDKGYWNQIESYIMTHSDAQLSHGLCPECAKKLYPEFVNPEKNK